MNSRDRVTVVRRESEAPDIANPGEERARDRLAIGAEMRLRLISAAVLVPVVIAFTWAHEISFSLVVLVAGGIILQEWLRMVGAGEATMLRWTGWIAITAVAVVAFVLPPTVSVAGIGVAVALVFAVARLSGAGVPAQWVVAGVIYSGLAVVSLIALRKGADGFGVVLFVFLVAWATDTAAFIVGRRLGGPRLWRSVSPAKTWSGALGGLFAGTALGVLVAMLLDVPPSLGVVLAAAIVAVAAQAGDLLESAAKRRFQVKDAGSIIPGHGGVMDRVDGLVAAGVATLVLGSLMGDPSPATGLLNLMGR